MAASGGFYLTQDDNDYKQFILWLILLPEAPSGIYIIFPGGNFYREMIKRITPDKWKHFFVGILMGAVLQVAGELVFPGRLLSATLMTLAVVVAVSYGFELLSLITGRGHYDIMDAVASIIGGITGMLLGGGIYHWVYLS